MNLLLSVVGYGCCLGKQQSHRKSRRVSFFSSRGKVRITTLTPNAMPCSCIAFCSTEATVSGEICIFSSSEIDLTPYNTTLLNVGAQWWKKHRLFDWEWLTPVTTDVRDSWKKKKCLLSNSKPDPPQQETSWWDVTSDMFEHFSTGIIRIIHN